MILIDTSTLVAWLDSTHEHHESSARAIGLAIAEDDAAISVVTLAELAAGGRTLESLAGPLAPMLRVDVTEADAWHAGQIFARTPRKQLVPLPDFFIRAQAAERGWQHLTNDRRRLAWWPDVDFIFGN